MTTDPKRELLSFLERKAFDPALKTNASEYSQSDRTKLAHVQQATRAEVERYRGYGSAEELVTNCRRDFHSEAAKKVHAELRRLGLPTLPQIRDEFEERRARSA